VNGTREPATFNMIAFVIGLAAVTNAIAGC